MKVSNIAIGTFVLAGLALGVAFVVLLGSGALSRNSFTLAFEFEGDVSGLTVGAPVTIKGFKIGTVRDLRLDYDVDTREFRTRALAELSPALVPTGSEMSVAEFMGGDDLDAKREKILRDLVQDGARAQLNLQSFVTGLLKIDIDFPQEIVPATLERSAEGYWVVPTQKSNFEILQRTLADLPLRDVADEGIATLRALRELAASPDLARSVAQSDELFADVRALVQRLDGSVARLETQATSAVEAFQALVAQGTTSLETIERDASGIIGEVRETVGAVQGAVDANSERMGSALAAAERTLTEIGVLAAALNGREGGDSALARDLSDTLRSAARALDALRELADFLERHPEALLRGKD
jgi:paraquat-inducible protein B